MKALILTEKNTAPVFMEEADPQAPSGYTLVHLKAAALNRRDYWITQGMYPGIQTPCILGSDGAGQVDDRDVIINPGVGWGERQAAQHPSFRILGMPDHGTFAEKIAVPDELIHDKPAHLSWAEAAALPLAGVTAYRAIFTQGQLQPGQSVLITGIGGGVAVFALQFAVAAGATVFVTSSSPEKISRAMALGASGSANYTEDDWAKVFHQECGPVDLVIDGAGGLGYNDLLGLLKPGGTIVNYGSTVGAPKNLDLFKIFWNQLHVVGSTMGSPADFAAMLDFVNQHQIKPVVDQVAALSEGGDLVASMAASPQFGKLVLEI